MKWEGGAKDWCNDLMHASPLCCLPRLVASLLWLCIGAQGPSSGKGQALISYGHPWKCPPPGTDSNPFGKGSGTQLCSVVHSKPSTSAPSDPGSVEVKGSFAIVGSGKSISPKSLGRNWNHPPPPKCTKGDARQCSSSAFKCHRSLTKPWMEVTSANFCSPGRTVLPHTPKMHFTATQRILANPPASLPSSPSGDCHLKSILSRNYFIASIINHHAHSPPCDARSNPLELLRKIIALLLNLLLDLSV